MLYTYTLYLIGRTELRIDEHTLRKTIAQWFFMSAVTGRYTGSPESRMDSDLAMLRGVTTANEFVAKLSQACNVTLTTDFWNVTFPSELATAAARSPSLFAYEAALVLLNAPVLFSTFSVSEMLDPATQGNRRSIERHHLFPRGHLTKLGITDRRDYNQIANFAYVEWGDNVRISDQSPADYLPSQSERFSATDMSKMNKFHALPVGWENMDYGTFLARRRELMAQIVREGYERLSSGTRVADEPEPIDLEALIDGGESDLVEFKSTLRVSLHTGENDRRLEQAALKTLAGFLNRDGGTLVIGVADDGSPVGIGTDRFENEDRMALHLTNIVNERMGANVWAYLHANFEDLEDDRVLVVRCEKSSAPIYVKDGNTERFFVRTGPATTELPVSSATEYIQRHFTQ